jgi:hypothetical protein
VEEGEVVPVKLLQAHHILLNGQRQYVFVSEAYRIRLPSMANASGSQHYSEITYMSIDLFDRGLFYIGKTLTPARIHRPSSDGFGQFVSAGYCAPMYKSDTEPLVGKVHRTTHSHFRSAENQDVFADLRYALPERPHMLGAEECRPQ